MTMLIREDFQPSRNEKCFCASGQRFKNCCGSHAPDRKPPHGVVVIENYLSAEQCGAIVEIAQRSNHEPLTIVDLENTTADEVVRKLDDGRVTDRVDIAEQQRSLDNIVRNIVTETIEPTQGEKFAWFEQPQLLQYTSGGFYGTHADSENFDAQAEHWRKDLDRDVSMLLYLNDEFEGGKIYFANFDYKIRPKAGMLVFFPSDNRYRHAAEEVTGGLRYAIVSWSALRGTDKVRSAAPDNAILLED